MKYKLPYLKIKRKVVKKYMNVIGKYLKDESGNYISPIVSISTIFDENNSSLRIDPGLPVGSGCDYYGSTAPEGYLFADGSAVSRTEYAELFEVIGTTYGAGDGSTTFNLPDKREAVTIMKGTTYATLGASVGANSKAIAKENIPSYTLYSASHTHTFTGTAASHSHTISARGGYGDATGKWVSPSSTQNQANWTLNTGSASLTPKGTNSGTTITVTSGGSGTAFNVMQKTLVCNYIIKAYSVAANSTATILAALEGEY